ncbi:MAG: NAD(+)/NADH kinase [Planctomycetes bacterium]|nr:NAD(+)/NADH kinase [Planctomycetota bacterium]NUQ34077.1 NAD(+)/NADH kinase [Planctomycetaceae bacterium]
MGAAQAKTKRVVLYGDGRRADVMHAIAQVVPLLKEKAELLHVCTDQALDLSRIRFDLLINFGGDGSILGAVRSMGANQAAVAGVNFGKVGFLATYELPGLLASLDDILAGRVSRQESVIQEATLIRSGGKRSVFLAVNDTVISRAAKSRVVSMRLSIDGSYVSTYQVDGIIVSTPVGSTAHSLGAGGPVLEPEMDAMVIAPICPHTLAVRPMAVPANRQIEIEVIEAETEIGVTFDGQVFEPLKTGDKVVVTRFPHRFILLGGGTETFYHNLRRKLLWGGHIEHSAQQAWRP